VYKGKKGPEAAEEYFIEYHETMVDGVKVLWPEKEPFYDLMIMRERSSEAGFYTEKQNEPLGGSSFWFPVEDLVYWDNKFNSPQELLSFLGDNKIILGAIDPSMGNNRKSDFSAIVTVCKDRQEGTIYVIAADIGRWQPDDLIAKVINVFCKWGHHRIGFEENGFQKFLGEDIVKNSAKQGREIPISFIKNTDRKENRIIRLQPMIKQGRIQFSKSHSELINEILHYPKSVHDDGIDALSMILDISVNMLSVDVKEQGEMFKKLSKPYSPDANKIKWVINPKTGARSPFDDPFGLFKIR
jgi:predicted phage terminase large subunit-like protein